MGVYSQFKSCFYFNAYACALYVLLLTACMWPASYNSGKTNQNENRVLAFGSLISNKEEENAMISDFVIVCSKLSAIYLLLCCCCSVYINTYGGHSRINDNGSISQKV